MTGSSLPLKVLKHLRVFHYFSVISIINSEGAKHEAEDDFPKSQLP